MTHLKCWLGACRTDYSLMPHERTYHCPVDGHPDDAALNGVAIYINTNTLRPVRAMLA